MPITKEFLESEQRSKAIRDVCISILNRIRLLLQLDSEVDGEEIIVINSELEQFEGQLIDLQIEKGMGAGHKKNEYEVYPVLAMQYIAGQIYNFFVVPLLSESDIRGQAGEFNLVDRPDDQSPYLIELTNAPDAVIDFLRAQAMLGILESFIDLQPEERGM